MKYVVLLGLTACFSRHAPIQAALDAEATDPVRAEAMWESLLDEELATVEWKQVSRHFCALREARLFNELEQLEGAHPTQIRALRSDAAFCPDQALQEALHAAEIRAADRLFTSIRDSTDDPFERLVQARRIEYLHPPAPAFLEQMEGWRRQWVEKLESIDARSAAVRAWLDDRAARVDGRELQLETLADRTLDFDIQHGPVDTDSSCRALGAPPAAHSTGGTGAPTPLTVRFDDCTTKTDLIDVQVEYTVIVQRQEWMDVEVTEVVTRDVPRMGRSCDRDYSLGLETCRSYVAYTVQESSSYTRTEKRLVWVDVPEVRVRTERRHVRTLQIVPSATVETATGSQTRTLAPVRARRQTVEELAASDLYAEIASELISSVREQSLVAAQDAQVARWAADASVTGDGLDGLLLASTKRALTEPEQDLLTRAFGLPTVFLGTSDLTPVAYEEVHRTPILWRIPAGTLRTGFNPIVARFGVAYTGSDARYEAHSTPRSLEVDLAYEGNFSLTTGRAAHGFGFHLTPSYGFSLGGGLGSKHQYVDPSEDGKPFGITGGTHASIDLMVGVRTSPLALFGGVGGHARGFSTGGAFHGSTGLPFTGRLEVRLTPRDPILLTGWFGDVRDFSDRDWGARLYLPLARVPKNSRVENRYWLTFSYQEDTERTQLPGVNSNQRVDGGRPTYGRTVLGLTLGL